MSNKKEINTITNSGETGKDIDEDSVTGRFGWEIVGINPIPYITRAGEKYCSVRMVEMKALNKYLNYLHQDIFNCTCIRSYYITESERRLLNEINFKHCDYHFGREQFTQFDLIVRLSDAIEFYNFLCSCYTKLVNSGTDSLSRYGFIRINKESVVPYTIYNGQKYVPLFYFESKTQNLQQWTNKLEGWNLSYLKFCCKLQGIRNELFMHDFCSVISLNDIKNYFPPGTLFEDYWPKISLDLQLLVTSTSAKNQNQTIQWTRQPVAPPIAHPSSSPKVVNLSQPTPNQVGMYSSCRMTGQHPYHSPQPCTTSLTIRTTYPATAGSRHMSSLNDYTNNTQGQPPVVPQSNLYYTNTQTNATPNCMIYGDQPDLHQINYHQEEVEEIQPPPMIPIKTFLANGGVLSPNSLTHQQPHAQGIHKNAGGCRYR